MQPNLSCGESPRAEPILHGLSGAVQKRVVLISDFQYMGCRTFSRRSRQLSAGTDLWHSSGLIRSRS